MKTPISYYGGKINLVTTILPLIPKHETYTEAFFGGGAVFFAKEPSAHEVINDSNDFVMNFYRVCKSEFESLKEKINATPFSRAMYKVAMCMYDHPSFFSDLQRAWAFYVLCNTGFSSQIGSWGYDKKGKRSKAFHNKKLRFDEQVVKRLESVVLEHNDACKVIRSRDSVESFHYVDPPYIDTNQGHYGGYEQNNYKCLLETLSGIKGKFLLSSFETDILSEYTKKNGWYTKTMNKPLSAYNNKTGEKRKRKIEVLTANYPIE